MLSRLGSQDVQEPSRLTSNEDEFADLDMQLGLGVQDDNMGADFELYGPSAAVDTQTAAQSQWVTATLENEAYNFFTFVSTKIHAKGEEGPEEGEEEVADPNNAMTSDNKKIVITLDELLPPSQNSQIVGAQALLHVLALTTKGLLKVCQPEPFGPIEIAIVSS